MAKAKRNAAGQFVKTGKVGATSSKRTASGKIKYSTMSDAELLQRIKRSGLLIDTRGYKGGSPGRPYAQRGGTNLSRDAQKRALPPGWRVSAAGKKYFENRRNRSDRDRNVKPWW